MYNLTLSRVFIQTVTGKWFIAISNRAYLETLTNQYTLLKQNQHYNPIIQQDYNHSIEKQYYITNVLCDDAHDLLNSDEFVSTYTFKSYPVVYKLTFVVGTETLIYYGSTSDFISRVAQHRSMIRKGRHDNPNITKLLENKSLTEVYIDVVKEISDDRERTLFERQLINNSTEELLNSRMDNIIEVLGRQYSTYTEVCSELNVHRRTLADAIKNNLNKVVRKDGTVLDIPTGSVASKHKKSITVNNLHFGSYASAERHFGFRPGVIKTIVHGRYRLVTDISGTDFNFEYPTATDKKIYRKFKMYPA